MWRKLRRLKQQGKNLGSSFRMGVSLGKCSATTSKCSNKSCKIECIKETAEIFGTTGAEF